MMDEAEMLKYAESDDLRFCHGDVARITGKQYDPNESPQWRAGWLMQDQHIREIEQELEKEWLESLKEEGA